MASIKLVEAGHTHPDGLQLGKTGEKIGFLGAAPIVRPAHADQAIATDAASVIVLANRLRLDLVNLGVIKGAA